MGLLNLSKRKAAAIILFLGMCLAAINIYSLIEAKRFSDLEKNLANRLIAGSELLSQYRSVEFKDWQALLKKNFEGQGIGGHSIDYLLLRDNEVLATSLEQGSIDKVKHLNLAKIAFSDTPFVESGLMIRSSLINRQDAQRSTYLVVASQLSSTNLILLLYKIAFIIAVGAVFFTFKHFANSYWENNIIPYYHFKNNVKKMLSKAGFYKKEEIKAADLPTIVTYLSRSIEQYQHQEQELIDELQQLKQSLAVEWEQFFKGLSIAAIKLYEQDEKVISVWGASEHLNQVIAPGVIDPEDPLQSIFSQSFEYGASVSSIESLLKACSGKNEEEVSKIIKQLPRNAKVNFEGVEKKLFFSWFPCFDDGAFTSMVLEIGNVGLYGQGQELHQVKEIEYRLALDVIRCGGSTFLSALTRMKEIIQSIEDISEDVPVDSSKQLKIKALTMEFRSILIENQLETLSAHLNKLLFEILPTQAFDSSLSELDHEDRDWGQLSPILAYIAQLATDIAESQAFKDPSLSKMNISMSGMSLDHLVSSSEEVRN